MLYGLFRLKICAHQITIAKHLGTNIFKIDYSKRLPES
jgi:hypothetical protein